MGQDFGDAAQFNSNDAAILGELFLSVHFVRIEETFSFDRNLF